MNEEGLAVPRDDERAMENTVEQELERFLNGETEEPEVLWNRLLGSQPATPTPPRPPAIGTTRQRSNHTNIRKNAWLLGSPSRPGASNVPSAFTTSAAPMKTLPNAFHSAGGNPDAAAAAAATTGAAGRSSGKPPVPTFPWPPMMLPITGPARTTAAPPGITAHEVPRIAAVEAAVANAPPGLQISAVNVISWQSSPQTVHQPTGPQPMPDIKVMIVPGFIVNVPYFAAHVSRRYRAQTASGRWMLRFNRQGQLRSARRLPD